MNLAKLNDPLDPTRVKKREGSGGRSLSYLEGHDVIRTANEIFGIGGWSYSLQKLTCLGTEDFIGSNNRKGIRVAYCAELEVTVMTGTDLGRATYGDVGYGDAVEYGGSILTPHELAAKEAVTDALKRALKNLGDQFGLCLYDKHAPEHGGRAKTAATGLGGSGGGVGDEGKVGATVPSAVAPTEKQVAYLRRLMNENGVTDLGKPVESLTKAEASQFIEQLKDGSFQPIQEFAEVGATLLDPDDIPFLATVDGLGN